MPIAKTKTFRSGNSEAVRLPRDLAFGIGRELILERSGDVLTIRPSTTATARRQDVKSMIEALKALPRPSTVEVREEFVWPERDGL